MKLTRLMAAVAAPAAALALTVLPAGSAAAGTGDGGGSADFTITTSRFTAYSCHLYRETTWPSGQVQRLYSCSGGVRYSGGGYYGVACAEHWGGWGWYRQPCSQL